MTTLRITDGTTTLDMSSDLANASYAIAQAGWVPAVGALRQSTMGGQGPYVDVIEAIPLMVLGTTPAGALTALGALSQMLDQAERWSRGENVAAVRIQYQPEGATQLLQAVVLGRAGTDASLTLPPSFHQELGAWIIDPLWLRFRRRGQWLAPIESVGPSAGADNPAVQTATFASSQATHSPAKVTLAGFPGTANQPAGVVVLANAADKLILVEAEDMTTIFGTFSVEADVANKARGGSVLRCTPASAGSANIATKAAIGLNSSVRRVAVWAVVRNNSLTAIWNLSAGGPSVLVDNLSQVPQVVFLGFISTTQPITGIGIIIYVSSVVGGPTLDIDYLLVAGMDDDTSRAIAVDPISAAASPDTVVIDPRPLTDPSAYARSELVGAMQAIGYRGDAYATTSGSTLAAVYLGTGGVSTAHWRRTSGAGTVVQTTLSASRWPAYLTPQ